MEFPVGIFLRQEKLNVLRLITSETMMKSYLIKPKRRMSSRNTHNISGRINLCASAKSHGIKS